MSSVCGTLFKLRTKITVTTKIIVYRSLAESLLQYLNLIWAWKKSVNLRKLQVCQNRMLKSVFNLHNRFHLEELYKVRKGIISVSDINKFQRCLYLFKSLRFPSHGQIIPAIPQHQHLTRNRNLPQISSCRLSLTEQRISCHGINLYNNIPSHIKESTSISNFKQQMYTYIQGELN